MYKTCDVITKHRGHQPLKGRWGIAVTLLHYQANEHAEYRHEGCLWDILRTNMFLFVCLQHIQLGSVHGTRNVVPYGILVWKGRYVLFGVFVLHTQIEYRLQFAILLENA